ncbi:MAG: GGDEF domain-containing protein [Oscillospiraceae bacterium]|nr:GGDEF domain-containing protein [Oscillospiraceae bacterium]
MRSRENEFYRRIAYLDVLTGIKNRNAYESDLTQLDAAREAYGDIWCIVIDLNGLKTLNDAYGHAAGDSLLQAMGHILDSVAQRAHGVYRIGGDEFVVLLTHGHIEATSRLIEALYDERAAYNAAAAHPLTFSMGFACYNRVKHTTLADMVREADEMMYNDKFYQKNSGSSHRQ